MTATIRIMRFILLACCLFAYSKQEDTIVCSKNVLEQLDKYLEQIEVVPNGKRRFPETIAELHEGCRWVFVWIQELLYEVCFLEILFFKKFF